jgi:hypothetical protein
MLHRFLARPAGQDLHVVSEIEKTGHLVEDEGLGQGGEHPGDHGDLHGGSIDGYRVLAESSTRL